MYLDMISLTALRLRQIKYAFRKMKLEFVMTQNMATLFKGKSANERTLTSPHSVEFSVDSIWKTTTDLKSDE